MNYFYYKVTRIRSGMAKGKQVSYFRMDSKGEYVGINITNHSIRKIASFGSQPCTVIPSTKEDFDGALLIVKEALNIE